MFEISKAIDRQALHETYIEADRHCVRIENALDVHGADLLHNCLVNDKRWGLRFCDGSRILGVPPETYRECSGKEKQEIADKAYSAAQSGFAFCREEIWGPWIDASRQEEAGSILGKLLQFINGDSFSEFLCDVVGCTSVRLVRISAERYAPGHFFGFAFGAPVGAGIGFAIDLTPAWQLEWGGLLEILNLTGGIEPAYEPRFNAISIYSLSKPRGVSFVQRFAGSARYSITGQIHVY